MASNVGVARVVAPLGELAELIDDGADLVVLVEDGVVQGKGQLEDSLGRGDTRCVDLGAQRAGAVEVGQGASVTGQGGDLEGEGGGALVESGQELLSKGDLAVGSGGVNEGVRQGEVGLGDGLLAGVAVLFGLGAGGGEGCGGLVHVAVGEVDVAEHSASAPGPAEGAGGGQCRGEVTGGSGEPAGGVGASRPPPSATRRVPSREASFRPRSR